MNFFCCKDGPWYNATTFHNLNGTVFKDLFVTTPQYRCKIMYGLHAYGTLHENLSDKMICSGVIPLPDDYTTDSLFSLSFKINFIDTWLKSLAYTFAWC